MGGSGGPPQGGGGVSPRLRPRIRPPPPMTTPQPRIHPPPPPPQTPLYSLTLTTPPNTHTRTHTHARARAHTHTHTHTCTRARTQSALGKERRELQVQQQRTLLEAIPRDLSRPWEDPMPEEVRAWGADDPAVDAVVTYSHRKSSVAAPSVAWLLCSPMLAARILALNSYKCAAAWRGGLCGAGAAPGRTPCPRRCARAGPTTLLSLRGCSAVGGLRGVGAGVAEGVR